MSEKLSYQEYVPAWGVHPTPQVQPISVYEMFRRSALDHPHKPAVIFFDKKITFQELDRLVDRFAAALSRLGVRKGDRIGALLPNCPQHIIAFLAVTRLGAIHVPANVMCRGEELRYILTDSGVRMVITLDLFYKDVMAASERTEVREVIVTGIDDFLPSPMNALYRLKGRFDHTHVPISYGGRVFRFTDLLKETGKVPTASPDFDFDGTTLILYTAGTTGRSKGVMLTHHNLVYNAASQSENFGLNDSDVNLVLFPLFHVSGYMLATLCMFYVGGTTILEPRFDAHRYLKNLHKYRVTGFFAPPTVYIAFLNQPDFGRYDLKNLRIAGASGAPVPLAVQAKWKERTGLQLLNGYGLTETTAGAMVSLPNKFNHDAIGVPLGGTVKIVNDDGDPVAIGEQGEILFQGPQVAKGYWNKPEETAATFQEGWLRTGDLATMDQDGFVFFVERKKDLIIASAYKIAPAEVEEVLYRHPDIREAAVIGVPDEYRGETVKAFVVLKDDSKGKITEADIIQYGRENMAAYKYPRIVEFVDELPKSLLGKVLRQKLREMEAEKRAQGSAQFAAT